MNSDNDTDQISRSCGESTSVAPSTALLNQRFGISPAHRMLTRLEIALLRRSKAEIAQGAHEVHANKGDTSRT